MTNTLNNILDIIGIAAGAAKGIGAGGAAVQQGEDILIALASIARAANQAHLDISGKPIDLNLLQPIEPVE